MSESESETEPLMSSARSTPTFILTKNGSHFEKSLSNPQNYDAIKSGTELQTKIIEGSSPATFSRGTNWWAILMTILSGIFFTLSSALIKDLEAVATMELLVLRSLIQVGVMLTIVAFLRRNPFGPPGYRLLLVLQGFFGGITLVMLFIAFRRLPLGDATTIIFSSPVFVLLLSFIFLREECRFLQTLIVFVLVTGIVFVAQPPFIFGQNDQNESYDVWGYSAAILCAFFTAINIVLIRKCKDVHFSVVVLHYSVWSLKMALVLVLLHGPLSSGGPLLEATPLQWGMAVLVGVTGLIGQVLLARALHLEGAGKVAVARSIDIVFAFVLQVVYWGEVPNWMSALGAVFVCVCVAAMGLDQQITRSVATIP